MPTKVLNYWRKNQPDIKYVNLYGPTEITCNCTFYKVEITKMNRGSHSNIIGVGLGFMFITMM